MLYKITDFENFIKIGEGSYGVVCKAINKITGKLVAIKQFIIRNDDNGIPSTCLRELSILKELQHPNIICMEQVLTCDKKLCLLFEYMDMDLKRFLVTYENNIALTKTFSYQIMQGLLYCHGKRIIHRDLKPENLLIDLHKLIIKIADFGLARTVTIPVKPYTHEVMTLHYRAPEIMLGCGKYSFPIDVWSVACIMAEMLTGHVLFLGDSEIGQLFAIFRILGTPDTDSWPDFYELTTWKTEFPNWKNSLMKVFGDDVDKLFLDLLSKMLIYTPENRATLRDALYHEFFDDLDKSSLPATDEEKRMNTELMFESLLNSSN